MINQLIKQVQMLLKQKGHHDPQVITIVNQLKMFGVHLALEEQEEDTESSSSQLSLNSCIQKLYEDFNNRPLNVTWSVSAHLDFSPLVWFADLYSKSIQVDSTDLYIFTCVDDAIYGEVYSCFKDIDVGSKLNLDYRIDDSKKIIASVIQKNPIYINRSEYPFVSIGAEFLGDPRTVGLADGYLMDIKITNLITNQVETKKLLYLFIDNLCFLDFWMKNPSWQKVLHLSHLVAINEGCALGGCKKSIFTYGLEKKQFKANSIFKPKLIIAERNDSQSWFPIKNLSELKEIELKHIDVFFGEYVYQRNDLT